jgi:hypothetical protein
MMEKLDKSVPATVNCECKGPGADMFREQNESCCGQSIVQILYSLFFGVCVYVWQHCVLNSGPHAC